MTALIPGKLSPHDAEKWAKRLLAWRDKGIDSYIYFDNDQAGYAAFNAQTLQELING